MINKLCLHMDQDMRKLIYASKVRIASFQGQLASSETADCTTRRGVHYNRGVSSLKPVSEQLANTLITLEPHGIF